MALNDAAFPVTGVLDAIAAAVGAGLPVKVNMVVKRGCNDQSVLLMAEHFRGSGHVLRLIEFMDVGTTNGRRLDDVVAAAEIIALTGTPSCARSQHARSRRWRCRTSAASRPRGQERPGRTPVPAGRLAVEPAMTCVIAEPCIDVKDKAGPPCHRRDRSRRWAGDRHALPG